MPDGAGGLKARSLAESVPFREVYIHGLVRDAERQKMSKTKGNVIDPIEVITKYGTDAVRFTLASQASPGTDIAFSEARTEGYRAFANKIWNAARFVQMQIDRAGEAGYTAALTLPSSSADAPLETRWILARLNAVCNDVDRALTAYRFDEAANAVYQFFWGEFCDWYVELVKLRLDYSAPKNDTAQLTLNALVECVRGGAAPAVAVHAISHGGAVARALRIHRNSRAGGVDCARPASRWRMSSPSDNDERREHAASAGTDRHGSQRCAKISAYQRRRRRLFAFILSAGLAE